MFVLAAAATVARKKKRAPKACSVLSVLLSRGREGRLKDGLQQAIHPKHRSLYAVGQGKGLRVGGCHEPLASLQELRRKIPKVRGPNNQSCVQ
ncbi:hypothetical protein I7I50_03990 [Histoplasma capsulatum G186AR]|uniref:Uncharacterized protein n=1 Tax=Ajellomyces capsulatus TaxID=5037 RepID=A0A8H7YP51_AJECA|nr:hypothetical protein I7I52_04898 [Histoplasma capsulatum]QSS74998.1 hypothetical protein I7I50_03990 [Histoplasma capsulatum G186AR]